MTFLLQKFTTLFLLLSFFSVNLLAVSTSCPGEIIPNLHSTTVTATDDDSGTILGNTTYYYTFTPVSDGTIQVNSYVSGYFNSLYIQSSCSSTIWSNTSDTYSKSSPQIDVTAGQQIIIALERRYSTSQSFNIGFTYTVTPAPSCSTLRDSDNLTSSHTFYTNSSHYNDSDWNVGPGSAGGTLSRAYHFTVDSNGTVDVRLYDVDNNQAKFSIAEGSCPTTLQGLSSSQLNFSSAGDFYVYIYYINGSNTNIEHKLDVTFSPPVPPSMGNIPDTVGTINTLFSLNIASYVTPTNGDPILEYNLTGTLPNGLSFNSTTGLISGTPTAITPASNFSITATDKDGVSNSDSFTITIQDLNIISTGGRNFAMRQQENLFGDVKVIGNTVLCLQNSSGQCIESGNDISNDDVNLQKAPESSSVLVLPTNAVVKYARLYWLGRIDGSWNSTTQTNAGQIEIKKDNASTYTTLTANIKDAIAYRDDIQLYSASADASGVVTGSGTYYINTSSFYTVTGTTSDGLGTSGSWALVVIYSDPDETTAKNITIFDGFKQVTSSTDAQASVVGFLTPKSGIVDSILYTMAAEGDLYLSGTSDRIQMGGANYNQTLQDLGTFNSRIDIPTTRTPNLTNNNGTDIHKYNVGTANGGFGIIDNNEVGAEFNFTSNSDVYYPSLFVFSTELYLPQMCYDYSLKQDGRYLPIDRATYPEAQIDAQISSSDIEVGIYLRNEESDLDAQGIAIRTDLNTTQFNQVDHIYTSNVNGSTLIDRGAPTFTGSLCDYNKDGDNSVTNNGCTDGHNIRKGNGSLGEYDYVYTKFILEPQNINGITDINESLGLSIKYYIVANGTKIEYPDYILGGLNVPICPPTGGYQPQWGQFNVVRSGQATNNITNNLYTQISRKPFNASVVFDSTPTTGDNQPPTSDINTTVLVEMIDIDAYGDINASCANPDAGISEIIFVPVAFSPTDDQVAIPTQTNDYYNFAVKNATFRIWYFDDGNQTLIQNWTATTTDSTNRVLTSISGLYDSSIHTLCTTSCTDTTSTTCFECIKINYAQPLCARDNFAVRPESYSLNIFDINQSLPTYDIETDPTNTKNTTKVNISSETGYAAIPFTPSTPIDLSAGYNYRFDINASGNDNTAYTPGYTRVFNGHPDYNATLIWTPDIGMTGCNDTVNRNISFYFKNGVVINEERDNNNVGKYTLNLIDTTWTAVDWQDLTHHTIDNGFDISSNDCITGSNSTSGSLLHGCVTTTNHGSDSVGNLYKDHLLTFHPYRFDITGIVSSVGLDHTTLTTNPYIYMADMSNISDENMSYHLNGAITAVGFSGNRVSNFVANCMSVGLDLNLSKSDTTLLDLASNNVIYQSRFHNLDENDSIITAHNIDTNETNTSVPLRVQTVSTFFTVELNGTMNTIHNINYHRTVNNPVNPKRVFLDSYDINCTNPLTDCTMYADLRNDKTTNGQLNIDQNLTHYYGRTNSPRQRFSTPTGTAIAPAQNFIYYEVHCDLNNGCDKSLLQGGNDANSTSDPRWFVNTNHTVNFGDAGSVNKKGSIVGAGEVTGTATSGNHLDFTNLIYDGSRNYPYKATMENNASMWLIFNRFNNAAIRNEFEVEFEDSASSWAGVNETNTSTGTNSSSKTNRRSTW
ncbi:MAG: putative Ig domain-containing protein [Campylobacterales bacterium]|nr:putative Ig domain-containing protein [Campylobacterales bacterium]